MPFWNLMACIVTSALTSVVAPVESIDRIVFESSPIRMVEPDPWPMMVSAKFSAAAAE